MKAIPLLTAHHGRRMSSKSAAERAEKERKETFRTIRTRILKDFKNDPSKIRATAEALIQDMQRRLVAIENQMHELGTKIQQNEIRVSVAKYFDAYVDAYLEPDLAKSDAVAEEEDLRARMDKLSNEKATLSKRIAAYQKALSNLHDDNGSIFAPL